MFPEKGFSESCRYGRNFFRDEKNVFLKEVVFSELAETDKQENQKGGKRKIFVYAFSKINA